MAATPNIPSAGVRAQSQIAPSPGSQPAQLQPGEQEKIQKAMLDVATNNRDAVQKRLNLPSAELIADETGKLQQQRARDVEHFDHLIATDERFAQTSGNPDFWNGVKERDVQRKAESLAQTDQQIATVAQREPEIRADLQNDVNFYNQRIAQLQAGPVQISQAEADAYRRYLQVTSPPTPPTAPAGGAGGVANLYAQYFGQDSFAAASAAKPPVAGLF